MKFQKKGAAGVVIFIVVFIILGFVAYFYGLNFNPNYSGWAPFKGIGSPVIESNECTTNSNCNSGEICVSTRVCLYSSFSQTCQCTGSTQGECKDYSSVGLFQTACSLQTRECGTTASPLCCPGDICFNKICVPSAGKELAQCKSIKEI